MKRMLLAILLAMGVAIPAGSMTEAQGYLAPPGLARNF